MRRAPRRPTHFPGKALSVPEARQGGLAALFQVLPRLPDEILVRRLQTATRTHRLQDLQAEGVPFPGRSPATQTLAGGSSGVRKPTLEVGEPEARQDLAAPGPDILRLVVDETPSEFEGLPLELRGPVEESQFPQRSRGEFEADREAAPRDRCGVVAVGPPYPPSPSTP
jgi:hypothetical protein